MKLHKLTKTCKPALGIPVLVYVKYNRNYETLEIEEREHPFYYVVYRTDELKRMVKKDENGNIIINELHDYYVEAAGEEQYGWYDISIAGWCYLNEINPEIKNEEKEIIPPEFFDIT